MKSNKRRERLSSFVEGLQASGRYTFRRTEAEAANSSSPVAVQASLRRLKQKGRVVSPRRGFYVIVPAEYRAAGAPPASWFIHDLMGYLDQPSGYRTSSGSGICWIWSSFPSSRTDLPRSSPRVRIGVCPFILACRTQASMWSIASVSHPM